MSYKTTVLKEENYFWQQLQLQVRAIKLYDYAISIIIKCLQHTENFQRRECFFRLYICFYKKWKFKPLDS